MESRTEAQVLQLEIESDPRVKLQVPTKLSNPDKLISEVHEELLTKQGYSSDGGLVRAWNHLNVQVTKPNVNRALRFMDTLIKALKVRGHKIEVGSRETSVIILGEKIKINCRELTKRVLSTETPYRSYIKEAIGILSFNTESLHPKQWKDGKVMLEKQISNIIATLEIEGKREYDGTMRIQAERQQEKVDRKKLLDHQDLVLEELKKFKTFLNDSKKYNEVVLMRVYIDAVKTKMIASNDPTNEELREWIRWAEKKVDWYDPLINLSDPLLDSVDKEKLDLKHRYTGYEYGYH